MGVKQRLSAIPQETQCDRGIATPVSRWGGGYFGWVTEARAIGSQKEGSWTQVTLLLKNETLFRHLLWVTRFGCLGPCLTSGL